MTSKIVENGSELIENKRVSVEEVCSGGLVKAPTVSVEYVGSGGIVIADHVYDLKRVQASGIVITNHLHTDAISSSGGVIVCVKEGNSYTEANGESFESVEEAIKHLENKKYESRHPVPRIKAHGVF